MVVWDCVDSQIFWTVFRKPQSVSHWCQELEFWIKYIAVSTLSVCYLVVVVVAVAVVAVVVGGGGGGGSSSSSSRSSQNTFIQGGPKKLAPFFLYALTLPNINRFSTLFHCQNQEKSCNNTVIKDPTTLQMGRYTTLWNISVKKQQYYWKQDFCDNTF